MTLCFRKQHPLSIALGRLTLLKFSTRFVSPKLVRKLVKKELHFGNLLGEYLCYDKVSLITLIDDAWSAMSIRSYTINEQEKLSSRHVISVGIGKVGGGSPIANFAVFLAEPYAEKSAISLKISLKSPTLT